MIASCGDDKLVKFWNPLDGKPIRSATGHEQAVYTVSFSPDGTQVASGGVDKTIRIWNVADAKELRKLEGHPYDIYSLSYSPDGKKLASIDDGGNLIVWDLETGKISSRNQVAPGVRTYCVAWSPSGNQIAVAGSDNKQTHKGFIFQVP